MDWESEYDFERMKKNLRDYNSRFTAGLYLVTLAFRVIDQYDDLCRQELEKYDDVSNEDKWLANLTYKGCRWYMIDQSADPNSRQMNWETDLRDSEKPPWWSKSAAGFQVRIYMDRFA